MIGRKLKYTAASCVNCVVNLLPIPSPKQIDPEGQDANLTSNARFLIVSLDLLGDTIMASVVPSALKKAYPVATVDILTRPVNSVVFQNNPDVDALILDEAPWWSDEPLTGSLRPGYLRKLFSNIRRLRGNNYDVVVDLRGDLRHIILFGAMLHPEILLAYHKTGGEKFLSCRLPYDAAHSELEKKTNLLKPLGIVVEKPRPKLWLSPDELQSARKALRQWFGSDGWPTVLLDPGAKPAQRWPVERYVEVTQVIHDRFQRPVLISAGPPYRALAEHMLATLPEKAAKLARFTNLRELFAVVAACDLVISADTGISHVASAVSTPTLTLMGPTDPARFWNGVEGSRAIKSPLSCCQELHHRCLKAGPGRASVCMTAITAESVAKTALELLMTQADRRRQTT